MANGAANYNLEEDIQHFVNEELNEQLAAAGFDSKKCGYKCDFNNGALSSGTLDPSIFKDSNSVDHQYSNSEKKFLCGPGGALEQLWSYDYDYEACRSSSPPPVPPRPSSLNRARAVPRPPE